jgi:hypothetical protein
MPEFGFSDPCVSDWAPFVKSLEALEVPPIIFDNFLYLRDFGPFTIRDVLRLFLRRVLYFRLRLDIIVRFDNRYIYIYIYIYYIIIYLIYIIIYHRDCCLTLKRWNTEIGIFVILR